MVSAATVELYTALLLRRKYLHHTLRLYRYRQRPPAVYRYRLARYR